MPEVRRIRNQVIACMLAGMTTPEPQPTSELDIDADASDIWQALTTNDGLAPWMGEGASIDAEAGGDLFAPDPVGGRPRIGQVDHVGIDQRLDFTWWPSDDPDDRSQVSITLIPIEVGTRVQVVEGPLTTASLSSATHSVTTESTLGQGSKRVSRPTFSPVASPASSRSWRCFATAWRLMLRSLANAVAVPDPRWVRSSTIWRRVGSARAAKIAEGMGWKP
jgi:uncharacterized protein YndB with AHSA1/START domain